MRGDAMKRAILFAAVTVLVAGGVRAADEAAVKVVKKGIEAHGGEEALKKAKGGEYKLEGDVTLGVEKGKFTGTISYALPDKFRMSIDRTSGPNKTAQVVVINGDKVKLTVDGKGADVPAGVKGEFLQLAAVQEVSLLYPLLDDTKFTLKAEKDDKADDKEVAVVTVTRKGMRDVKLMFDKKTGELVRFTHKMPDPLDPKVLRETETTHSEFKKFDGVVQPTVQKVKQDGKEYMTFKVAEVKLFEKPDLKAYVIE
jgi:outer membrane lipoprotein-sorting protein